MDPCLVWNQSIGCGTDYFFWDLVGCIRRDCVGFDADLRVVEDGYLENVSAGLSDVQECEWAIEPVYMNPCLSSAIFLRTRRLRTEKWNPF
jgi:hypothetical protein